MATGYYAKKKPEALKATGKKVYPSELEQNTQSIQQAINAAIPQVVTPQAVTPQEIYNNAVTPQAVTPQVVSEELPRITPVATSLAPKSVTPVPASTTTNTAALPTAAQSAVTNVVTPNAPTEAELAAQAEEAAVQQTGPSKWLQQLIDQYNQTQAYTPKTAEEIRAQAEGETRSYYDQLRLAAQQAQERGDLALAQQIEGLQRSYDRQREDTQRSYDQAYSQTDRQLLSRGMQRSSYGAQTLANVAAKGAEAQGRISEAQTSDEAQINAQRAQLEQQLADTLSGYSRNEVDDIEARIREIEDQEYERGMTDMEYRNRLSAQIYEYLTAELGEKTANEWREREFAYQQERDTVGDTQFERQLTEQARQFDASLGMQAKQFAQDVLNDERNYNLNVQQLAEQVRQFDANNALNMQRLAQDIMNDDRTYSLQERQFAESVAESLRNYQLNERAQTFNEEQARISNEQWQKTFEASQEQWQKNYDLQLANQRISAEQWQAEMNRALANDQLSADHWLAEMNYNKERGLISDQQWQQQMDYQRERNLISDQQWQTQMDYQRDKDAVTYSQWQKEFLANQENADRTYELNVKQLEEEQRQFDTLHPKEQNSSSSASSSTSSSNKASGTPTSSSTPGVTSASSYSDFMNSMDAGAKQDTTPAIINSNAQTALDETVFVPTMLYNVYQQNKRNLPR